MIRRIVKLVIEEDRIDTFKEIFEASKQTIVGFPGCHHLELWQSDDDKTLFFTYSLWDDVLALDAYRKSDTFRGIWAQLKEQFGGKPEAWSSNLISIADA